VKDIETYTRIEIGNEYHDVYLNPGGTIALISMNVLNSYGLEDIYISLKNEEGKWSYPINLGPAINTRGFEISPFLSEDNKTLYFASDGHDGLGDADILCSHRLDSGWQNWTEPMNMGPPFNTKYFDAYLYVNQKKEFFFVSNRNGHYSDIYKVTERIVIPTEDLANNQDIVENKDLTNDPNVDNQSDTKFKTTLYFEFDEFKLKKEELEKLQNLAMKMINSRQSVFEIYGYTDNTGSPTYNKKLSEKRAKFVYRYLKQFGIDEERLYMEGKGILVTSSDHEMLPYAKRRVDISGIDYLK
jgi:outer membrane protein OmpA-like peptidoglycan-associated protein